MTPLKTDVQGVDPVPPASAPERKSTPEAARRPAWAVREPPPPPDYPEQENGLVMDLLV